MNLTEAIAIYLATPTAENIVLGELKLITDRNTRRVFTISGSDWNPTIEQLTSENWTLIFNQEM